jgi:hypothetical protein
MRQGKSIAPNRLIISHCRCAYSGFAGQSSSNTGTHHMLINVNADLFRAVYGAVSFEKTRYYLQGVFIEPHHTGIGATLVATDGYVIFAAYDDSATFTGTGNDRAIVKLSPAALKACKSTKSKPVARLTVDTENALAIAYVDADMSELSPRYETARCLDCVINDTFPAWRRVLPQDRSKPYASAFDARLMARVAGFSVALGTTGAPMTVTGNKGDPALVRFTRTDHAFAIIMPHRDEPDHADQLPAWV